MKDVRVRIWNKGTHWLAQCLEIRNISAEGPTRDSVLDIIKEKLKEVSTSKGISLNLITLESEETTITPSEQI